METQTRVMDTITAIETRRAVKHYDPDFEMPQEDIDKLLGLARLAPTAFNIQNWRFVVVKDKALRQEIRKHAWDQAQVTDASLLIVMCCDLKAWAKNPERYWKDAPKEVADFLVPAIQAYYEGKPDVERDEGMRSCGLAGQTIMLAAKAMGYESCPMDGFDFDAVGKLINLPGDHAISFMIAVGKGIKEAWPRPGTIDTSEAVITDRFA